jgi:hypothetical protein
MRSRFRGSTSLISEVISMKKLLLLSLIAFCLVSASLSQSNTVYLSPSTIHFGDAEEGGPPVKNSVTLYNKTSSAITISEMTFVGDNGFSVVTNGCGSKLAANSSCNIVLEFNPNNGGGPGEYTATFYVYDSASNSPQTASLIAVETCRNIIVC